MKYVELFGLASKIYGNLPCKAQGCPQCKNVKACEYAGLLFDELMILSKEEEIYDNGKNSNSH